MSEPYFRGPHTETRGPLIPFIAGALVTAPLWLLSKNNEPCCGYSQYPYQQPYTIQPYPYYQQPIVYPYPQPYPQPYPMPYPYNFQSVKN